MDTSSGCSTTTIPMLSLLLSLLFLLLPFLRLLLSMTSTTSTSSSRRRSLIGRGQDDDKNMKPVEAAARRPLPPGSMGYPYIGETFQLYSDNPINFFAMKQDKYGPIFKTHILGCPCIMVSSPEAAKFVLVTKATLFKPTFPASKERMLGPQAIFFQQGDYHTRLRRLVLRAFMPQATRDKVAAIQQLAVSALNSWDGHTINTYQQMKIYAFNVALLSIFGKDEMSSYIIEELKQCYYTLEKGYNSMPINLPGTLFHKSMKARRQLGQIVADIISSRRQRNIVEGASTDLLASFMDSKEALTDAQIADNIIGVIFAARDTTASVLTWIIKYLAENPNVLKAVTEEQMEIIKLKEEEMSDGDDKSLTWADTKRMPFTCRVIQETMRVASILSFTFREAVEDVEYQGYLIPKGWKVLPLFRNIHHCAENFSDPEKFDPSRFELPPKPNTFMPFGSGTHACPGNELAKLEMLVLLHHLTTKYRWSLSGSETGIQFGPFALPTDGLPIRLSQKANTN
ncbi:abscisic acid 8'-hydroxylase 1-like [Iris pallida]|uniref:(+)-abscisic acid 8'-hydroxylase n=1 Tax=Iris pallida TaxID=29817 RepID=A0AAX6G0J2_IRIPA|nr:abscisic acid 8'-hydroxylase 1-like [Iris pallida]KAJ6822469.1 abscisic acid 8'-hydroxylase 1-like [Iris pallida]